VKQNGATRGKLLQLARGFRYTVTACSAVILPSDFVQVENMRTYKKKTKRSTTPKEMYTKTAKGVLAKAFNLRKASVKYSVNFMKLQRHCKLFKKGVEVSFIYKFYNSF
jgi:hypothetical protein